MKLDEGKGGGDDPFTEEEKAMLDEGARKIKAAMADTKKTKVRESASEQIYANAQKSNTAATPQTLRSFLDSDQSSFASSPNFPPLR